MAASFERACSRCGKSFTAKTRRASFCSGSCRALASKDRAKAEAAGRAQVVSLPGAAAVSPISIEAVTLEELGGQAATSTGRQALMLARRLDAGVSDSSLASVSRRLDELLAEAGRQSALLSADEDSDNPIAFLRHRAAERLEASKDGRSAAG